MESIPHIPRQEIVGCLGPSEGGDSGDGSATAHTCPAQGDNFRVQGLRLKGLRFRV